MICCLNPYCNEPLNQDDLVACKSCGTQLVKLLRDRFKIIEPIGRGGFGKTYLAEDIDKLNERCIIKQLIYQGRNQEEVDKIRQLFEQEARQLQQLGEHPQIPALFAYFQSNNYFFLAQQLINGRNLLQELEQEGLFMEANTRHLLQNLLPVLQYVHNRHVIHRDIKPENIIRQSGTNNLVLIDFGVSKVVPLNAQTQTGTIIGSHGYSSPEQIKGRAKPCSDLFSLGATCFHLLTGIHPSDLWTEKGYNWVDDWQQYLPYPLDPQFAYVLNRLLVKDYLQRYQSAAEVLRDLKGTAQYSASGYIASKTTSTQYSTTKPASQNSTTKPSSTKATSARSHHAPTKVTAPSTSSYSRQLVSTTVDSNRNILLERSPLLILTGMVLAFVAVCLWVLRSPTPQNQNQVVPSQIQSPSPIVPSPQTPSPQPPSPPSPSPEYPSRPYPPPPYPPPRYPPRDLPPYPPPGSRPFPPPQG
ncbi:MAG TPA: serine/threonine-protein kinase [Oculatellaceae cyanobacterium]|jgi:serine/threonine protein kinase